MSMPWGKQRTTPIAIDFGANTVKMVQLSSDSTPRLVAAASTTLPGRTRQSRDNRLSVLSESIKMLMKQGSFKGKRVLCSIPAFQTLVQHFEVSADNPKEIDHQVQAQMRERLSVDPTQMVVRNFDLGEVTRNGTNKREVLCLAANKQSILQYIELCRQCKLEVVGMHAEPMATLELAKLQKDQDVKAYIDIGAMATKVTVISQGKLVFAKLIHAGSDQVTQELASQQQIDFDEANKIRISGKAPILAEVTSEPASKSSLGGMASILEDEPLLSRKSTENNQPLGQDTYDTLIDELSLCVRHYQSFAPDDPIDKLIFVGGESNQTAACQRIARSLRIAAQLGDPFSVIQQDPGNRAKGLDLSQTQPAWAVPIGLALCEPNL